MWWKHVLLMVNTWLTVYKVDNPLVNTPSKLILGIHPIYFCFIHISSSKVAGRIDSEGSLLVPSIVSYFWVTNP